MPGDVEQLFEKDQKKTVAQLAKDLLGSFIQYGQYVGEVWSSSYDSALIMVHDFHRRKVGGISSLSFLVATRIKEDEEIDFTKEDTSIILLRVMDAASLPDSPEAERIRANAAKQATDEKEHWDESGFMDGRTANELSHAGVKCRVIGTFFLDKDAKENLILKFGSDLSNYYPNRGLKVYKPNGDALRKIVNYRDPQRINVDKDPLSSCEVHVGEVRYASTNRPFQGVSNVPVSIAPADLLAQKTAVFGITRIGKSNTTKIMAKAVFELRFQNREKGRIGQLIFDAMGEYANENVQDASGKGNPAALKNVWKCNPGGVENDVATFGTFPHLNDPKRKLMKLNFYAEENIQKGKEIVNRAFGDPTELSDYRRNFVEIVFDPPDKGDRSPENISSIIRFDRQALVYRAILAKAGLPVPKGLKGYTKSSLGTPLFSKGLIEALRTSRDDPDRKHAFTADVLAKEHPSWDELGESFEGLADFIKRGADTGYTAFNDSHRREKKAEAEKSKIDTVVKNWHDALLQNLLEMFLRPYGIRRITVVAQQHSPDVKLDYAEEIYEDLKNGKLVIVDQSSGDSEINRSAAERVMWKIYQKNQELFRNGKEPPQILIYIEEAHNLLPSGKDLDEEARSNVWVRTAKEGAKLGLGLVYATQEVSSIHRNILKNTANWFIGHLNCTDETKELRKFYDFEDFEYSILRAQDKGFLRVKTLSNFFVVPTQIKLFSIEV